MIELSKRIGVLTGGGNTPALNATLKGIALECEELGFELIGLMQGWAGVLKQGLYCHLVPGMIDENRGGTILQSSRTNLRASGQIGEAIENLKKLEIDALIPIGGDDTLSVGSELSNDFATTFVTKTIDNDVGSNAPEGGSVDYLQLVNYFCPGFPSAANRIAEYVRDIRTTAYSHNRIIFVEAMGRYAGWLTLASAYGHPDLILVPEIKYEPDNLAACIEKKYRQVGNLVVVVSEGITGEDGKLLTESEELDSFGHARPGGCSELIAQDMKERLPSISSSNLRHQVLAYMQRCGNPIPIDRDTAIQAGRLAVQAIKNDKINHVATIMRTENGIEPQLLHLERVLKRDEDGRVIRRSLDLRFYNAESFRISEAGIEYFRPIFGNLPESFQYPDLNIQYI